MLTLALPGDLPEPGIEPRCPALQADSLPSEPPGKTKNTGVSKSIPSSGELPDPGIEPGFLHCRWVLYQLSYLKNPILYIPSDYDMLT